MSPLQLALWGLAGGFVVEGLELVAAIRRTRGWPWRVHGEVGLAPYLVSVALRLAVSGVLAAALGANGQVSGPAGAAMIGITAPLIVEKAFRQLGTAPASLAESPGRAAEPEQPLNEQSTSAVARSGVAWEAGDAT
jgi:hypothetical protein